MTQIKREFGKIKYKNDERGFGFVKPDFPIGALGSKDLFVHTIKSPRFDQLQTGDRVSFVIIEGRQGFEAAEVEAES